MTKVVDMRAWVRRRSEQEARRGMVLVTLPCGCQVGWPPGSPPVTECPAHAALEEHKATKKKKTTTTEPYVIARCSGAGVHAGYLVSRNENGRIILRDSRRIWRFNGAQTLSEVAVYGLSEESRIAPVVNRLELRPDDVHELIWCQPAGQEAIESAKEWRA